MPGLARSSANGSSHNFSSFRCLRWQKKDARDPVPLSCELTAFGTRPCQASSQGLSPEGSRDQAICGQQSWPNPEYLTSGRITALAASWLWLEQFHPSPVLKEAWSLKLEAPDTAGVIHLPARSSHNCSQFS